MLNARALIIDDDKRNLLVLDQLLRLENVTTFRLASANGLSHQLDSMEGVEVVFLDLEMPGMDGYEALDIIRAHPNARQAKVIAYTVHVSELNRALESGFDGFLGKPVSAEAFPAQLKHILNGERVCYLP